MWENDKKQLSETEESTEDDYSIVIHESRKKVVLGKCHSFGMDLLEADLCNVFSNFKGFQCIFINLFQVLISNHFTFKVIHFYFTCLVIQCDHCCRQLTKLFSCNKVHAALL